MNLLSTVTTGRKVVPLCVLLYGVEGIGKTTFGAKAPNPIIVGGEENDEVDVPHLKITSDFDQNNNPVPGSQWIKFNQVLNELLTSQHNYRTLVIDTLDSLEPMVWDYVLKDSSEKNMARALGGYGAAFRESRREFTEMRDNFLVPLRSRGMNIILLAHSLKSKFEDPITNSTYDTYEMKLHKDARGIFTEYVSSILFANYVNYKTKDKDSGAKFVVGTGERRIFTEKRPSHDAKNRFGLNYEMPLCWDTFVTAVKAFYAGKKQEIQETVDKTKEIFPGSGPEEIKMNEEVDAPIEVEKEVVEKTEAEMATEVIKEKMSKITDLQFKTSMEGALLRAKDDLKKLSWIQGKLNTYFEK